MNSSLQELTFTCNTGSVTGKYFYLTSFYEKTFIPVTGVTTDENYTTHTLRLISYYCKVFTTNWIICESSILETDSF